MYHASVVTGCPGPESGEALNYVCQLAQGVFLSFPSLRSLPQILNSSLSPDFSCAIFEEPSSLPGQVQTRAEWLEIASAMG